MSKFSFKNSKSMMKDWFCIVGTVVLVIVFSILSYVKYGQQYFLTWSNWKTILTQTAPTAIVALGQSLILLTGNFDLSLGRTVCLTSCVGAVLMVDYGWSAGAAVLVMLLIGLIIGVINGIMVSYIKVPAMIATLGTQYIAYGVAKLITNAAPVTGLPASIAWIGSGAIGGVFSYCVLFTIALYLIAQYVTHHTKAGRLLYAVGSSRKAAYYAGVQVKSVYFITFVISGVLSAVGGLILMSRMNSAAITLGQGYEFDAVIAAIIGGISLSGGKGNVMGKFFGCIFLVTLFNGFSQLGIDPFVQDILKGAVLVIAILMDVITNRKEE